MGQIVVFFFFNVFIPDHHPSKNSPFIVCLYNIVHCLIMSARMNKKDITHFPQRLILKKSI